LFLSLSLSRSIFRRLDCRNRTIPFEARSKTGNLPWPFQRL